MITLYDKKATDYTMNGIVVLNPYIISAKISERMNGEYKLDMELAVDPKTMVAENEMLIKVPAPMRETPQIDVESTQTVTRDIYKVTTGGQRLYLRVKPSQSARGIHAYKPGTEVAVLDKSNIQWYKVAVLDGGASGYMYAANLTYVRSETQSQGVNAPQSIVTPAKTRDQLFRISKITSTLESIQIEALHISYDMRRNYVKSAGIKGKTGADALKTVFASAMMASDFTLHSDIEKACEENITGKSLVAALLSDGGLVDQAGGEVLRDNYDLYWYKNIGHDRGVSIAYRKNMAGMEVSVDTSDVVTRIIPVGYNKKNEPIYGDPVDSAHVAEYAHPYIKEYTYKDVKIGSGYKTEAAVKTELVKRAAAEYDAKIDLPKVSATVEYVDIKNTNIGRDFAAYTNVYIGDTVRIRHEDYGFDLTTEVVAYVWDCIVNEYESIELDSKQAQLSDIKINPSMIGNGTLAGRKLGVGVIMNANMAANSVESDQIADGAIDNIGKMTQIVVDALTTDSLTAVKAEINRLAAGEITTDQLYADLARIAAAQITAANIDKANINWADIKSLTTEIADIANASIGTAKIDWAKIYDLTTDTAIITEGEAGKLYIARLNVTEANMVNLTVGELMLKAADSSFKRLTVDADGNVSAETVTVEGGNIANATISGGKLIENTITARELNVESIFADTALIRAIKAANIDVSDLFAASATVSALDAYIVKASTITALKGQLDLWASDKITAAVGGKLTPEGVAIGSSISMDAEHVEINTPYFDVDVTGDAGDLHIDENGMSADTATFNTLNCDEVVKKYTGASTITLAANSDASVVGAALNNKCVTSNVAILLNGDINGLLDIRGTTGNGNITINGQGHTLNGHVWIVNNAKYITILNLKVSNSGDQRGSMHFHANRAIRVSGCTFNGNNLSTTAGASQGLRVYHTSIQVENCEFYNMADFNMVFGSCADAYVIGCKGDGTKCVYTDGANVKWSGTRPSGSWGKGVPSLTAPADLTTLTIDTGSATPAETPVTTASFKANTTGTYYPSGHWMNDNVIRQGHEGTGSSARRDYGCMWFAASSLKNKTIKSATLTIKRVAGKGRSSSVTMKLWTTTVTGKSGVMASSTLTSLGEIGKIANGETLTVSVPVSAIATIAAGGGLVLYTEETANASGKTYSANYAHFDGTGGSAPVLTVTYQ